MTRKNIKYIKWRHNLYWVTPTWYVNQPTALESSPDEIGPNRARHFLEKYGVVSSSSSMAGVDNLPIIFTVEPRAENGIQAHCSNIDHPRRQTRRVYE